MTTLLLLLILSNPFDFTGRLGAPIPSGGDNVSATIPPPVPQDSASQDTLPEPAANKPVELWYYYSSSCPPCIAMKPIVDRLEKAGVKVTRIDCTGHDYEDITAVPVFRFYQDGKKLAEVVGATSEATLRKHLNLPQRKS